MATSAPRHRHRDGEPGGGRRDVAGCRDGAVPDDGRMVQGQRQRLACGGRGGGGEEQRDERQRTEQGSHGGITDSSRSGRLLQAPARGCGAGYSRPHGRRRRTDRARHAGPPVRGASGGRRPRARVRRRPGSDAPCGRAMRERVGGRRAVVRDRALAAVAGGRRRRAWPASSRPRDLGTVIADTSTVDPDTNRRWHAAAGSGGVGYLDAPLSGGEPMEGGTDGAAGRVRDVHGRRRRRRSGTGGAGAAAARPARVPPRAERVGVGGEADLQHVLGRLRAGGGRGVRGGDGARDPARAAGRGLPAHRREVLLHDRLPAPAAARRAVRRRLRGAPAAEGSPPVRAARRAARDPDAGERAGAARPTRRRWRPMPTARSRRSSTAPSRLLRRVEIGRRDVGRDALRERASRPPSRSPS